MNTVALNSIEVDRLQQAADWFILLKEAPAEEAITKWMDWCESDPQNLTAFEEIKSVWVYSTPFPPTPQAGEGRVGARFTLPVSLAAALLLALTAFLFIGERPVLQHPAQTLSTPLAMHSDSVLDDGSHVALGALSRVSSQFSNDKRLVVVEAGEAYFKVSKDPRRPFVVKAGPVSVTAIGTAFNVRRGTERIVVTVTEGRVGVASMGQQPVEARAGQQLSYSMLEPRMALATVDPRLATAWQQGVFKYVREPLADVVADLNRYTPHRIVIADEKLAHERYTGTVFGGHIDDWLGALQNVFPVRVVESAEGTVLIRRD